MTSRAGLQSPANMADPADLDAFNSPELKYLVVDKSDVYDPTKQAEWTAKELIRVPHKSQGFVTGSAKSERGDELEVEVLDTGKPFFSKDHVQKMIPPKFNKVEDVAELTFPNEASVLHKHQGSLLFWTAIHVLWPVLRGGERVHEASHLHREGHGAVQRQEAP
ncbi:hypothetical protein HPB48_012087 [Haemaphysalis longicornis]|uniref:Uncharacterized protein n=1 Tax=Haemaphysalis longicornis TaxID=44386 RepID=A0A9J6F6U5_HAELO|nr:hypothetical protein HPB48_012087 [Haemaphysalis longicornis]